MLQILFNFDRKPDDKEIRNREGDAQQLVRGKQLGRLYRHQLGNNHGKQKQEEPEREPPNRNQARIILLIGYKKKDHPNNPGDRPTSHKSSLDGYWNDRVNQVDESTGMGKQVKDQYGKRDQLQDL